MIAEAFRYPFWNGRVSLKFNLVPYPGFSIDQPFWIISPLTVVAEVTLVLVHPLLPKTP